MKTKTCHRKPGTLRKSLTNNVRFSAFVSEPGTYCQNLTIDRNALRASETSKQAQTIVRTDNGANRGVYEPLIYECELQRGFEVDSMNVDKNNSVSTRS